MNTCRSVVRSKYRAQACPVPFDSTKCKNTNPHAVHSVRVRTGWTHSSAPHSRWRGCAHTVEAFDRPRCSIECEQIVDGIPLWMEDEHRHVGTLPERCQQLLLDAMVTDTFHTKHIRSDRWRGET